MAEGAAHAYTGAMTESSPDPFNLTRFVAAQSPVIANAFEELTAGRKRTHWMWFVFPQLAGLGASEMSQRYAISGLEEARAYLAHSVLGRRLVEGVEAALGVPEATAIEIFGEVDAQKFRSCLTLFGAAATGPVAAIFHDALARFYDGAPDPKTVSLLSAG